MGSKKGPQTHHLPIQLQLMSGYNEAPLLLLFHPEAVHEGATSAGKLPLTIYETQWESSSSGKDAAAMDVDGHTNQGKSLKYRELSYTVETTEVEMISVDFVARGGGNATAVDGTKAQSASSATTAQDASSSATVGGGAKGKGIASDKQDEQGSDALVLTAEDEELLSSITAKTNAIRMLHARIQLLHTYLASLPPSYLSDPSIPPSQTTAPLVDQGQLPVDQTILRNLLALLSRLPILAPPSAVSFIAEAEEARSDTALIELLSSITGSVSHAKELGRKFAVVENARHLQQMRHRGLTSFGDAEGMGMGGKSGSDGFLQSVLGETRGSGGRKNWA